MEGINMLGLLPLLPGDIGDIETKVVLKKLTTAHQALAELKGVANSIPNQGILINTLSLQEAKDSSTTQNAIDGTFATTASSLPTAWLGQRAKLYTRRPSTWENLSATEAALLDFLRSRGEWSDLSPSETNQQLLNHFRFPGRFERLVAIAHAELPRVRAMLGAIGQELKYAKDLLQQLRMGLNPYSRFEFGKLSSLWYAQEWQAK
jgi:hypothetical protein